MLEKTNTMVEFVIRGDDFDPAIITSRLGVEPTKTFRKGDFLRKKKKPQDFSFWKVRTEYKELLIIDEQTQAIYDLFKEKIEILNELKEELNLEFTLGVVAEIWNDERPEIHFYSWLIDFAHEVGAEIDIDLYANFTGQPVFTLPSD